MRYEVGTVRIKQTTAGVGELNRLFDTWRHDGWLIVSQDRLGGNRREITLRCEGVK